jgi:hypothetical protein
VGLTTQEKKVLGFLLALTLLGGAVLIYRASCESGNSDENRLSRGPTPTSVERKVP